MTIFQKILWSANSSYVPPLAKGEKHYWVRYIHEGKKRKVCIAARSGILAKEQFLEDFPYAKFNRVTLRLKLKFR